MVGWVQVVLLDQLFDRPVLQKHRAHAEAGDLHRVGDVVEFPTPDGAGKFAGVVREAGDDWLLFDFNHPLAGQPVTFEAQLIGVM